METCKYYKEYRELCYCSHKDNKEDYEGNCGKDICPLGSYTYDVLLDNKTLKAENYKIKNMLLRGLKTIR